MAYGLNSELVVAAKCGDSVAINQIMEIVRYQTIVMACNKFGMSEETGEDLAQEVSISVLSFLPTFASDNYSVLVNAVQKIIRNTCLNHRRATLAAKRGGDAVTVSMHVKDDEGSKIEIPCEDDAAKSAELNDSISLLMSIASRHSEKLATMVSMLASGYSREEICQKLGWNRNMFSGHFERLKQKARAEMAY